MGGSTFASRMCGYDGVWAGEQCFAEVASLIIREAVPSKSLRGLSTSL